MAGFGFRVLCGVLIISNGIWFLILLVQLESCRDSSGISLKGNHLHRNDIGTVFIITPTYPRIVQKAELTRLVSVFRLVPAIHWIVVEDANEKSDLVSRVLVNSGLSHTHLVTATPPEVKLRESDPNWLKPRGVLQRNAGLAWLRKNLSLDTSGVVYFADDDNTYSSELFEEMRSTKKVAVWPVGLVGKLRYESPIIVNGKVVDWHTYWYRGKRPFAMDMAGFCISIKLILENTGAIFNINARRGFQESEFLQALSVTLDDLEPKADMCTKVLVWHTRTESANTDNEEKMSAKGFEMSDPSVEI